jgi:hypothetical protein
MNSWWEESDNPVFVAYLCYETVTAVFSGRGERIIGWQPYIMRLPYTQAMVERYNQRILAIAEEVGE